MAIVIWVLGFVFVGAWPVWLVVAAGFAVYGWIQWQGQRWKIAALGPAIGIVATLAILSFPLHALGHGGQFGPLFEHGLATLPLVLYCVGLTIARVLRA